MKKLILLLGLLSSVLLSEEIYEKVDSHHKRLKDGTKLQSYHKKVRGTENQEWKIERI